MKTCVLKLSLMLLGAVALTACKSKADRVFDACMAQMEKAANEATCSGSSDSATEKALASAAGTVMGAVGGSLCEELRAQCKADPDGALCEAALRQYD